MNLQTLLTPKKIIFNMNQSTDCSSITMAGMKITGSNSSEEESIRALQAIQSLGALFGLPLDLDLATTCPGSLLVSSSTACTPSKKRNSIAEDSVAAWSVNALVEGSLDLPLAGHSVECPPYSDPASVLITDLKSLEFELEEAPDGLPVSVTSDSSDDTRFTSSELLKRESDSSSTSSSSRKVTFQETLQTVEIPSHRDMDAATIDSIWNSVDSVNSNMQRNSMEYYADGRDWQNITEEDGMVLDEVTGELIHPATYEDLQVERLHTNRAEEQRQRRVQVILEQVRQEREAAEAAALAERSVGGDSPPSGNTKGKRTRRRKQTSPRVAFRKNGARDFRALQQTGAASLTRFADT